MRIRISPLNFAVFRAGSWRETRGKVHYLRRVNMKRFVSGIAAVAFALGLTASVASAQPHAIPTYAAVGGVGVTIMGDFARGLNDESGKTNYFGGRIELGLPMFNVYAGAGTYKPDFEGAESQITFGGAAAVKLLKGPEMPVGIGVQAGVGYESDEGINALRVPFGVVLSINVPSPNVSVTPWIMPRGELVRISGDGESQSEFGFGASGGLSVVLPMGLDFHAALDWLTIDFGDGEDTSVSPLVVGVGVSYHITVPSLGM
jgi:hypothetical protein